MSKYKKAWQLTRDEARIICESQTNCSYCPLSSTNGCLRSVVGFEKWELNKRIEVGNNER